MDVVDSSRGVSDCVYVVVGLSDDIGVGVGVGVGIGVDVGAYRLRTQG